MQDCPTEINLGECFAKPSKHSYICFCMQNTEREEEEGEKRAEGELRQAYTVGKSKLSPPPTSSFSLPSRRPHLGCVEYLLGLFSRWLFPLLFLHLIVCMLKENKGISMCCEYGAYRQCWTQILTLLSWYCSIMCHLPWLPISTESVLNMLFPCQDYPTHSIFLWSSRPTWSLCSLSRAFWLRQPVATISPLHFV